MGFPEEEEKHMTEVLEANGGTVTNLDDPACTHVVSLDYFYHEICFIQMDQRFLIICFNYYHSLSKLILPFDKLFKLIPNFLMIQ